jgi:DNA-binding response OmpR family regulator
MDAGASMKVLVVDDDRETRDLFSAVLLIAGFSVTVAANGWAALNVVAPYDAMVTDIDMPGMTGLQLIQRIRATRGLALPIVIVTGLCSAEVRAMASTASCAVLDKPCDTTALVDTLRALLAA